MIKKFIDKLFKRKNDLEDGIFLFAQLNDKIMPIDRGLIYEDPLNEYLIENQIGEVTGGGTFQEDTGELLCCEIEIELTKNKFDKEVISKIINKLEELGAPKGSKLIIESTNEEIYFGKLEGLAIYLDGQNLPPEVYSESDINFVLSELHRLTGIEPNADRNWEGEKETALYFYNDSFDKMKSSISEFINTYPLCKNARIEQIS